MSAPRMSVVLVTDEYRTIRRVLASLRRQTIRDQLELVIVLPRVAARGDDVGTFSEFAAFQLVEVPTVHPMPVARAAGIRAATAPIVFLGETHSFPHPELAEKLLESHKGEWDFVVPGLANANPQSPWSWGSFLIDYGTWHETLPEAATGGGPTWNVAYRKSLLLEADGLLELAMEHGDEMAEWLRHRGVKAYFQPGARLDHANVSQPKWWVEQRFLAGVLVASARRKRWSLRKRLLYVAASPLIPGVIVYRLRHAIRRLRETGALPRGAIAAVIVGALIRTAGEVVGYVSGARPHAQSRMDHYELHKLAFTEMDENG
jgi:hypothetical protein